MVDGEILQCTLVRSSKLSNSVMALTAPVTVHPSPVNHSVASRVIFRQPQPVKRHRHRWKTYRLLVATSEIPPVQQPALNNNPPP